MTWERWQTTRRTMRAFPPRALVSSDPCSPSLNSRAKRSSFASPSAALTHYRTLCTTLQSQLQQAEDDLRDLRELQDELERELERFEDGERGMRSEVEALRSERDDWKVRIRIRAAG